MSKFPVPACARARITALQLDATGVRRASSNGNGIARSKPPLVHVPHREKTRRLVGMTCGTPLAMGKTGSQIVIRSEIESFVVVLTCPDGSRAAGWDATDVGAEVRRSGGVALGECKRRRMDNASEF